MILEFKLSIFSKLERMLLTDSGKYGKGVWCTA